MAEHGAWVGTSSFSFPQLAMEQRVSRQYLSIHHALHAFAPQ